MTKKTFAPGPLGWRAEIAELATKAGFQPDGVTGCLICTPAVIENFARALLAANSEGMSAEHTKRVPHEPTKEMLEEGREQLDRMGFVKDVWQAMYCAAPAALNAPLQSAEPVFRCNNCESFDIEQVPETMKPEDSAEFGRGYKQGYADGELAYQWNAPFQSAEPDEMDMLARAVKHAEHSVSLNDYASQSAENRGASECEIKWPEGYCLDPNGKICVPHGKDVDFNFGYDLGYNEAMSVKLDAIADFKKRLSAENRGDSRRDAIYRKALAIGDAPASIGPDTHEHNFEIQPSSSIKICTYCGMSEVAAKKAENRRASSIEPEEALEEALRDQNVDPDLVGELDKRALVAAVLESAQAENRGVTFEISCSESDDRTWLRIKNSTGSEAVLSCKTNNDSGETVASQVVKQFATLKQSGSRDDNQL